MLTRDQIVTAAIELLDAEGIDGLSMRRLGTRLGSAATAPYWHVKSKDELVVLAADEVWGEIGLPDPAEMGWRSAAASMARDLKAMLTRHSWLVQAMGTHRIYGPIKARHDDHGLGVYEAAGFAGWNADRAMATVIMFVLGRALGEVAETAWLMRLRRDGTDQEEQVRGAMAEVIEIAMQFPRLRARIGPAGAADSAVAPEALDRTDDESFEFGLEAIFDGLQSYLAAEI